MCLIVIQNILKTVFMQSIYIFFFRQMINRD